MPYPEKCGKKHFLTKTVDPNWYRRYAKVLNYDDRLYMQPLREIREEEAIRKGMLTPPNPNDRAAELSRQLLEARKKKIKLVLQILEGNIRNLDLSSLNPKKQRTLLSLIEEETKGQKQTLFWRQRAVRPQGYILPAKSRWRLFWDNPSVMGNFHKMVLEERSNKIKMKWRQAYRLLQSAKRFNAALADLAGTTEDAFKRFLPFETNVPPADFEKTRFKATSIGSYLGEETVFTLTKPLPFRTKEAASIAARSLRVMRVFAEFPVNMQEKICSVAWYLELDKYKMIIREGQTPDSFYFLLGGKVASVKSEKLFANSFKLMNQHKVGSLIGEEGIDGSYRGFSVYTIERCKVIAVNFEDFHLKCLEGDTDGANASHISFLSQLGFMKFFPMQQLVNNAASNVLLFYYNDKSVVTRNVSESPYIYVVYKGSCKVLAEVTRKSSTKTQVVHVPPNHDAPNSSNKSSITSLPILGPNMRNTKKPSTHGRSYDKSIDSKMANLYGKRTIADSLKRVETWEDKKGINMNLIGAASIEKLVLAKPISSAKENRTKDWIQLKLLREGDVIGLETLDLGDAVNRTPAKFVLVSEGAQVIMILKSFFMDNMSDMMKMDLRASGYIFPDEMQLLTELDRRSAWKRFQNGVMNELSAGKKKK